jgi:MarR family transcriptional regulator, transcriptional regulator for hemolysin
MRSMITKHDDLLGTLVHDVAHLLRLDIDRRVAPVNLTRIKWLALGIIHRKPGLTQAEVAAELELGAAAVGRLVDRLEDRGFVLRSQSPDDRRAYFLSLTPAAERLVDSLDGTAQILRDELLEGFSEQEVTALNRGLNKLKANLQKVSISLASILPIRGDTYAEVQTTLVSASLL